MLAKPENREEAVAKLFKSVGGRHHDWLAISEFPDEKAAASAVLAAAAGGSLSDVETTVAMTAKDAATTFGVCWQGGKEVPERRTLLGSGATFQRKEPSSRTKGKSAGFSPLRILPA
jgi:hypothetical protein